MIKRFLATTLVCWILNLSAQPLLIKNVTLISAERDKPLHNANVLVTNGTIEEVSQSSITPPTSASVIDARGQFLIPGLMDSHVHVSSMPGASTSNSTKQQDLTKQFHTQQPRSYLYYGITQLLDPSQSAYALKRFNAAPDKPDLFHCGAAPVLHGYPTMWVPYQHRIDTFRYLIIEDESQIPAGRKADEFTPEQVIARIAQDGAICVKVFIEDGFGTQNNWPLMSHIFLQRVKRAAQKHNLILMAHANAIDMQEIASKIDVDVVAHGMWNWNQYDGAKTIPLPIKQILNNFVERKTAYQTTFNVMNSLKGVTETDILKTPGFDNVVPEDLLRWYQSHEGEWFKRETLKNFDLPLAQVHRRYNIMIKQGEKVAQYLNQQQHPFILASDTPPAPTFASQPGLASYQELQHLAKIGVSLENIFKAATLNNAKVFKLDHQYATIEPGKIANLLLLNKNPLKSVSAYDTIDKVILRGKVIQRDALKAR